MAPINKAHAADLLGAAQVALDATSGIVDIVERMHRTIQLAPLPLGQAPVSPARGLTGLAYRSVRGVVGLVESGIRLAVGTASRWLPEGTPPAQRDAVVAALNGVHGGRRWPATPWRRRWSAGTSPLAERLVGDGLVPLDSALGRHPDPGRTLRFPAARRLTLHGTGHLQLLEHPEMAAQLRRWLVPAAD